ncbi:hypothetical protein ZOSMA_38G00920 [Zostera marina]|uniref:Uncharacterized protein n=1 Tax=Zostera marina TaxID=29655 RepID=A0A0K9P4P7_ZOSMR|nr:hypothetical protein ZOSMA_38G00920 [Zostera marina]
MSDRRRSRDVGGGGGGGVLKKGPWTLEEDKILKEFVGKYGAREWSSIRSKGFLPRSGKSCRLRWVNKLKPNLKSGCKFSIEEQETVISLQAKFGNKWAKIATFLEGRTDNDVKNFWSTRKKKMARLQKKTSLLAKKKNLAAGRSKILSILQKEECIGECSKTNTEEIDRNCTDNSSSDCEDGGGEDEKILKMAAVETVVQQKPASVVQHVETNYDDNSIPPFPAVPENISQLNSPPFSQLCLEGFPILPESSMDFLFNDVPIFPDSSEFSYDDLNLFQLPIMGLGLERQKYHSNTDHGTPGTPSTEDLFNDFPSDLLDYPESPTLPPPPSSPHS